MKRLSLLLLLSLASCINYEKAAKKKFSEDFSCPLDQITTKARTDLRVYDLMFTPSTPEEPPAEVKSDPARLAVWQKKQDDKKKQEDALGATNFAFEASGCAHQQLYVCTRDIDGFEACSIASHTPGEGK